MHNLYIFSFDMRRFLYNVVLFFGMTCVVLIGACFFLPGHASKTMLGALPKKYANFDALRGERYVLLGGSGTYEGFDTAWLAHNLKRPVYNLGLHAGLGLVYTLQSALEHLHENDVVIVSPEYANFTDGNCWGNLETVATVSDIVPEERSLISFKQWIKLLPHVFEYGATKIRNIFVKYGKDKSNDFDVYGDNIWDANLPGDASMPFPTSGKLCASAFSSDAIEVIRKFVETANGKGVKTIFVPPAYASDSFRQEKEFIDTISVELEFICRPDRYAFDRKFFFDTAYHLNPVGRRLRSECLLEDLKKLGL